MYGGIGYVHSLSVNIIQTRQWFEIHTWPKILNTVSQKIQGFKYFSTSFSYVSLEKSGFQVSSEHYLSYCLWMSYMLLCSRVMHHGNIGPTDPGHILTMIRLYTVTQRVVRSWPYWSDSTQTFIEYSWLQSTHPKVTLQNETIS